MELIDRVFAGCLVGGCGVSLLMLLSAGLLSRARIPIRLPKIRLPRLGRARVRLPRLPKGGSKPGVAQAGVLFVPPGMMPIVFGLVATFFGAGGLALHAKLGVGATASVWVAAGLSIVLTSAMVVGLWQYFMAGAGESEVKGGTPIGKIGHVSVAIPEDGVGAIALVSDGKRVTMPAVAHTGASLSRGADIMVVDVAGHRAVVEEFVLAS